MRVSPTRQGSCEETYMRRLNADVALRCVDLGGRSFQVVFRTAYQLATPAPSSDLTQCQMSSGHSCPSTNAGVY